MTRWKLPISRRAALLVAVAGLALAVFVPAALATTTTYWGYNNLTASNPPANTCFSGSAAGIALQRLELLGLLRGRLDEWS